MINSGVLFLIVMAIILTIVITILLIWSAIQNSSNTGTTGDTGPSLSPCNQTINQSSLIQIPINSSTQCIQNGIITSKFCIADLDNGEYDYVVAPWGSQPLDVCVGFCTGYTGGICNGPIYNGRSAQDNFNKCMEQLNVKNCIPPLPIASNGSILYYAFSPTCNICDNR
jgi:hypothetical protein